MKVWIAWMNVNTGLCGMERCSYVARNLNYINNSSMKMPQKEAAAKDIIAGLRGEIPVEGMSYWVVFLP